MKTTTGYIFLSLLFISTFTVNLSANELKNNKKTQQTVIINSKIKGSQQQPKVLYIMPWQGIKTPIVVKGKVMRLALPKFKPINPKVFKQQVSDFNKQQQLNNVRKIK
ncbi:MAG: hypothetical protein JKX78_00575 [Alteromonadaceae bacterium]|nr:hypothetical protein [Alteromonadaceae bacterium]